MRTVNRKIVTAILVSFLAVSPIVGIVLLDATANPITYEPPEVAVLSPVPIGEYNVSGIPLSVEVTISGYTYQSIERISWLSCTLDGQENVSTTLSYPQTLAPGYNVTGVGYLSGLSNGTHSLAIKGLTTFNESISKTVSFTVNLASDTAPEADSWKILTLLPTARAGLGVAAINGKIYAIGGRNTNRTLSLNEVYDPSTNTWAVQAPMPVSASNFGIAVYQNKIYCIGGNNGTNQVYDPATNTWEIKTAMPTPRSQLQANVVNGKVYLPGGLLPYTNLTTTPTGPNIANVTEVYDPSTDSWATLTPIPIPVFSYASVVVDGKIYVVSGYYDRGPTDQVQIYNPESNSWSTGTPIPISVSGAAAAATTGAQAPKRIYVMGGKNWASNESLPCQVYNPETGNWALGSPMLTAREGLAVTVVDDVLYAVGGASPANPQSTLYAANEQYTPLSYESTQTSPSPSPSVPEIPPLVILPFLIVTSVILFIVGRKMRRK